MPPWFTIMERQKQLNEKIETGYRFGHLVVEAKTSEKKNGFPVWLCRCDCGNTVLLDTRWIKRGTKTDCGCITKLPVGAKDIAGQRFGRLTAIEPTGERGYGGCLMWYCLCDCGNYVDVPVKQLTSGYKKSCGCWGHPPISKLEGKRFGNLTVLNYVEKREGQNYWHCICDCGNEVDVRENYLKCGHTVSCGCKQASQIIENLKLVDGTSVTILEAGKKHLNRSNTSGCTGVYFSQKSQRWIAQITFRRKTYYLGSYVKKEDAITARKRGEEMHDDFLEKYYSQLRVADK